MRLSCTSGAVVSSCALGLFELSNCSVQKNSLGFFLYDSTRSSIPLTPRPAAVSTTCAPKWRQAR